MGSKLFIHMNFSWHALNLLPITPLKCMVLGSKEPVMYTYEDAVKQLQETGHISLMDFKTLSYDDLEELLDEIKKWCVYANGNTDKLEKKSKKKKKKKDKN